MRRALVGIVLAALAVVANAGLSDAATVRPMALRALIDRSDFVVYARVLGNHGVWDPATQTIWTVTDLRVLDGPKGHVGSILRVTEPGGVIGDIGHLFPGVPKFEENQELVLFLYSAAGNRVRVLGLYQGVYYVSTDAVTKEKVARPAVQAREPVYEAGQSEVPRSGRTSSRAICAAMSARVVSTRPGTFG